MFLLQTRWVFSFVREWFSGTKITTITTWTDDELLPLELSETLIRFKQILLKKSAKLLAACKFVNQSFDKKFDHLRYVNQTVWERPLYM